MRPAAKFNFDGCNGTNEFSVERFSGMFFEAAADAIAKETIECCCQDCQVSAEWWLKGHPYGIGRWLQQWHFR
ncbi:MAG: hypothetical protein OXC62_00145 [Aestuariivita sp.]|nr:hypothetical protein [Aestuariivita sp.]